MKKLNKILAAVLVVVSTFGLFGIIKARAATNINLGNADSFAVLASLAVVDSTPSTIIGDVGLTPTTGASIAIPSEEEQD